MVFAGNGEHRFFCVYFSRAFPLMNGKGNSFVTGSSVVFYAVEKDFNAAHSHFAYGLLNGTELWNKERTESKTVETENGNNAYASQILTYTYEPLYFDNAE